MGGIDLSLMLAFGLAVIAWAALSAATIVGRLGHDARSGTGASWRPTATGRSGARLVRRAARHHGESGKWRRIAALTELARVGHPRSRVLMRRALGDADADVVGAAVRALGNEASPWATELLVYALRRGRYPRSRVAAQLERLAPAAGADLLPLLDDPDPAVRFWAATLLGRCRVGRDQLVWLTRDPDPNVRAAAVEALAERRERGALSAVRSRLDDDEWFVRVHACRAVGALGTIADAPTIALGLRDSRWWVRAAAKDALRGFGLEVAGALVPFLDDGDRFARNGAAEVLQDIGFVDVLAAGAGNDELLKRIFDAGGQALRDAARARWTSAGVDATTLAS